MHVKWQEVHFDIMSAVGHTLQGSMSVSESVQTYCSPKPTISELISSGYEG